jgi:stage III sporulation protein AF
VLFANFIEMLLPNNKFRAYVRVVIGFFVILVIMGPIINLFNFSADGLDLSLLQSNQQTDLDQILTEGNKIRQQEVNQARKDYKDKLAQQLEAVIKLNSRFEDVQVDVELSADNQVERIIIISSQSTAINPVQIDSEESETPEDSNSPDLKKNLKELLTNLYDFNKEQIEVKLN